MKSLLALLALSFGSTALLAQAQPVRLPPTRPAAADSATVSLPAAPAPVADAAKPKAKAPATKHAKKPAKKKHKKKAH